MPYPIPTSDDRRLLFRLLQQNSSLAAWRNVAAYHRGVVELFKRIHDDPDHREDDGSPLLDDSHLSGLLSGMASMDKAIAALATGDRSVFRYRGYYVAGYPTFWEAYRWVGSYIEGFVEKMFYSRGQATPIDRHPLFPLLEARLEDLSIVWSSLNQVLEMRHLDLPAPIDTMGHVDSRGLPGLSRWPQECLPPPEDLPDPPHPGTDLVATGKTVPVDGIWEPVLAPGRSRLSDLFRPSATPPRDLPLAGCMNYLVRGAQAPSLAFEEDAYPSRGRSTLWRLVWHDDRYENGRVPDVESSYDFPSPRTEPRAIAPEPAKKAFDPVSGDRVPHSGQWRCRDLSGRVLTLAEGDVFPKAPEGHLCVWTPATQLD